ncbi:MAG: helix-turn-helix transcriptional regulator [Clostridiales bacterium]|nr:helix-turn-helix transcriptional regulator [Clostridiales bacterium]
MDLAKIRETKKMTQQELSEAVGLTRQTISAYENGVAKPSPEKAKKIAEILGFDWTLFYEERR